MGLKEDEFVDILIRALSNESVISKLQEAVCGQLQKEVSLLKDIVKKKDDRIEKLERQVAELESGMDQLEQYRRNSVRISGIKEANSEDIVDKTMTLFNDTMNVDITHDQIDRIHRVGRKNENKPRSILVKFATYRARDKVMRNRKVLKNISENSTAYQYEGQVFINEDLTAFRSNLLYQARQLKKDKQIEDCWSWDGNILIKNRAGKIMQIHSIAELQREAT